MKNLPVSILVLALLAVVAGCGSSETDTTGATASNCKPGELATKKEGILTVATDKPAYPPYFEDDDPTNGEGFESAVAYAIANEPRLLESRTSTGRWCPFNSSYAPGPKDFDFDVNQISITPTREKAVDFSAPYYTANQAVVALKSSEAAERDLARRPEVGEDRRPDRHHQPRRRSKKRSNPTTSRRSSTARTTSSPR